MQSRPYALIRTELLDQVQRLADQALQSWCDGWGAARQDVALECLRAWDGAQQLPAAPAWCARWQADTRALSLTWPAELPAQVQRLLYPPDRQYAPAAGSAVTAEAAGEAGWQALWQALAAALVAGGAAAPTPQAPAADEWRHASGAVLLVLRIGRLACHALLDHGALQALAEQAMLRGALLRPTAERLAALDYAGLLAALPVSLPVQLGAAAVDLGSLMRLQAGDVIRLDSVADRALRVNGPSGAPLFDGYLGRAGDTLALELAPHDTTNGVQHEQ